MTKLGDAMGEQPVTVGIWMPPDYWTRPESLVEAYRRGDPLRAIAHDFDDGVPDISEALIDKTVADDELEHLRSVRRRGQDTMRSVWHNVEMITRLDRSGVSRSDIPAVLQALGYEIDVKMAAELLLSPGDPRDDPTILPTPKRLRDKLSLLYIAGVHAGIEPDYQLALGKMSLDSVAELRQLFHPHIPYRQLAEILAVIETTARAIRTRKITTLTYSDYDTTARTVEQKLGHIAKAEAEPWPVPATTLRHRYGRGYWEEALKHVGLTLLGADGRHNETDHWQALDDFTEECLDLEYPMDVEIYDRWALAESTLGRDRPSALELHRRYGSWEQALEAIFGDEEEPEDNDLEPYWGFPFGFEDESLVINKAESQREAEEWQRAGTLIGDLLAKMPWNSFLRIEYDGAEEVSTRPYAQATPSADGVWCEIVSEKYLPAGEWPINRRYFANNGWLAPDGEVSNWLKVSVPLADAGHQIVRGLRHGRGCRDAGRLRWSTGDFPTGPGPDGGVTLDDAVAGAVQTLRNAS